MRITDYKPFTHHVENYELSFSILKDLCVVQSKFRIKRQLNTTSDARSQNSIELNGEGVQLIWLKVDGHLRPLETLVINTKTLVIPHLDSYEHTIEMETTMNPFSNKSLEGLYDSKGIISSQCEAESFRKITYFADRPDVMTTFKVRIEADQKNYPVLLSNGNLIEQGPVAGHRHFAVWEDSSRKPCYLFAMVAGDLAVLEDHFKTKSGKSVKLQFYASQDKISECQFALDSLKHAMEWDERIFDLEYDLDQYMVVSIDDFNAGAMENKGLNIFNSKYVLADQMSATDQDFEHIESVIAHEYFHNYSGNRITLRDWFHLSLKEGLTVFRDQEFSAERLGAAIQRVETVNLLKSRQFTEDAGPNRHPVLPFEGKSVDNFFTATIYEKGSEVIRMIQVILGKKLFQEVLKKYFRKFDGQAITILDFVQHFEEETSFDFTQFKNWYIQSGTPKVHISKVVQGSQLKISFRQDLSQNRNHHVLDSQFQSTPASAYLIPILVESNMMTSQIIEGHSSLRKNSDGEIVFIFKNLQDELVLPWNSDGQISLFKNFSAPVLIDFDETISETVKRFGTETDDFNAFEIAQTFHSSMILSQNSPKVISEKEELSLVHEFAQLLKSKMRQQQILPSLKSKLLEFPSFQSLSTQLDLFNPDLILNQYQTYRKHMANDLRNDLLIQLEICQGDLEALGEPGTAYSPASAGLRAFEFQILDYLIETDSDLVLKRARRMIDHRKNFTDVTSGLKLLISLGSKFPLDEISNELRKWKDNSLVLSKIFKIISAVPKHTIVPAIHHLMKENFYNSENPNHVYGMVRGLFENYTVFHHSQTYSETYAFMAEQMKYHDQRNPQVAARLAIAFQLNAKLPARQKAGMKEQLQLLQAQKLSPNLNEKIAQAQLEI